jgi:hypothetical protein
MGHNIRGHSTLTEVGSTNRDNNLAKIRQQNILKCELLNEIKSYYDSQSRDIMEAKIKSYAKIT